MMATSHTLTAVVSVLENLDGILNSRSIGVELYMALHD